MAAKKHFDWNKSDDRKKWLEQHGLECAVKGTSLQLNEVYNWEGDVWHAHWLDDKETVINWAKDHESGNTDHDKDNREVEIIKVNAILVKSNKMTWAYFCVV